MAQRIVSRGAQCDVTIATLAQLAKSGSLALSTRAALPETAPRSIPRHPTMYVDAGTFQGSLSHRKVVYRSTAPPSTRRRRRLFAPPAFSNQPLITPRDLSVPLAAAEHLLKLGVFAVSDFEIDGFLASVCGVSQLRTVAMPPMAANIDDVIGILAEVLEGLKIPVTLYVVRLCVCVWV
jgi:hypothetical protein